MSELTRRLNAQKIDSVMAAKLAKAIKDANGVVRDTSNDKMWSAEMQSVQREMEAAGYKAAEIAARINSL